MGKKGSWFSAIKRAFAPSSKDKLVNESEKKSSKEKKRKGLGKLKHGDSFIPLFREPSSIEKILGEAEREQHHLIDLSPLSTSEPPRTPSFVSSRAAAPLQDATSQLAPTPPWVASPPRVSTSRRVASPPSATPQSVASPPKSTSPQRATTPPRSTTPQRATTPPKSTNPQRATTPPKSATPQRATTPPKSTTPQRATTPPKSATPQRVTTPPKSATPQRITTPPKSATLQRVTTPPKGSTSQSVISLRKSNSSPKSATPLGIGSPPKSGSLASSPNVATSSNAVTPPKATSSRFFHCPRPEPTLKSQHICATRIQAAYRGHMARRSYRALRGLVRLQEVVKGQSVKRQTTNAMKSMQLLVRVQTQIHSRRIQMLENQAIQRQVQHKNDKDLSENGNLDEWDDSMLTKDEVEARRQRKFEAITKRERAMAYAYSNQSGKSTPKTAQAAMMDFRSTGGFPWWWNRLDRHMNPYTSPTKPPETQPIKNFLSTPPKPATTSPLIPHSTDHCQRNLGFDNSEVATPRSTRSAAVPSRMMKLSPTPSKFTRSRATSSLKDDDSLTSCPPFSMPRYMEPTMSAKAKLKGSFGISLDEQSKRRVSFPLAQSAGSFKWNKRGSLFSASTTPNREAGSQRGLDRKQSMQSIENLSVDSTVSMPTVVGRKPFNRFV